MKSLSNLVIFSTLLQIADSLSTLEQQQQQQQQRGQGQDAQPRVVGLPVHRSKVRDPISHDRSRMRKRDGPVTGTLDNLQTLYFLNTSLGTPPQDVRLHVDTGSSDMWVNTPASRLCALAQQPCSYAQAYSANASSTYRYVGGYFNISYLDGTGAAGDYATDVMRFSGQTISSFQFGVGYESTSAQNVLGIGYPSNEVQVARARRKPYQNLPAKMHADGIISSNSFSLWLNDVHAETGSILFGGLDTSKFQGNLVSVPIQKVNNAYSQFLITMTGLDVGPTKVASDMALGVLLDSGSSLTYLPKDLTTKIYGLVNAAYQEDDGAALIPCSSRKQNATMTFRFSSPASITVSLSEMILGLEDPTGEKLKFGNGAEACLFGIVPAEDSSSVLGDTFLRSAYVVYDMDNNEISLANAKTNVSESNIVEIKSGGGAVPSSTKARNPVVATTGIPSGSGGGTNIINTSQDDSGAARLGLATTPAIVGAVAVAAALML